jgi:hypothetical protein
MHLFELFISIETLKHSEEKFNSLNIQQKLGFIFKKIQFIEQKTN